MSQDVLDDWIASLSSTRSSREIAKLISAIGLDTFHSESGVAYQEHLFLT
jgi:hypothetical protein